MKLIFSLLGWAIVISFACITNTFSQTNKDSPKGEIFLDHLVGIWNMPGEVEGKPVEFSFEAKRLLHDKFVLMHMKDLGMPSQYEADVYIGYDTTRACYVTFWIDNFGVDSTVSVLGYGKGRGDSLIILFNFPNEPFRDTFTYNTTTDTWKFLLEDGNQQGTWKRFAEYKLTRKTN